MSPTASTSHRLFRIITPLLLLFGVQWWLVIFHGYYGLTMQQRGLLILLIVAAIPPVHRGISTLLDRVRLIQPRTVWLLAAGISVLGAFYFPETAWLQGRDFQPKWQDEFAYRIGFQQMAHGRLWYPQHPCADFFDTFQVLVRPVYASIYFPGPSLLYTPTLLLHLPYWIMSSLLAGLTVGALFLAISELIDPAAGLTAVPMLLGTTTFRKLAIMVLGYPLIILLTTAALFAWLRWRKTQRIGWAIAIGGLLGWAAITRPLDAVIVALPIGIDFLISLRSRAALQNFRHASAVVAAALPFILLQIIFNLGVTGHATLTPFEYYAQRDYPDTTFGFHTYDPTHRPASVIAQKQRFHDVWTAPAIQKHTPAATLAWWFPKGIAELFDNLLPNWFLIILIPVGLTGLFTRGRVLFALILLLNMALYSFYAFRLPHYTMSALPAVTLLVLLGVERVATTWRRGGNFARVFLTACIVFLSLTETAEFNRFIRDEAFSPSVLSTTDVKLAALEHTPAVVLFHFPADGNPHEEPVYNSNVPWPDDAKVVRAHDLGQRNREIFRYYASHQPDRAFYRYDRADDSVTFLGFAKELGKP